MTTRSFRRFLAFAAALSLTACPKGPPVKRADPNAVSVYTSLYPDVIEAIRPAIDAELAKSAPGMRVEWVQGGSSRIRRKLDRELSHRR